VAARRRRGRSRGGFFFLGIRNKLRDLIADLTGRDIFPQDIYFLSKSPPHTDHEICESTS
jgi:hypothetical protein